MGGHRLRDPGVLGTLYGLITAGGTISLTMAGIAAIYAGMLLRTAYLGERGFVELQTTALRATDLANSLAVANREISEANTALERLANTDALTGLGNRLCFNAALARATGEGQEPALVLADLDAFKAINDTRATASAISSCAMSRNVSPPARTRESLPVRLGGDEFAILVVGAEADARAVAIAARLVDDFATPREIGGRTLSLGLSIGVASGAGKDGERLCSEADAALYRAKTAAGASMRVYDLGIERGRPAPRRPSSRSLVGVAGRGERRHLGHARRCRRRPRNAPGRRTSSFGKMAVNAVEGEPAAPPCFQGLFRQTPPNQPAPSRTTSEASVASEAYAGMRKPRRPGNEPDQSGNRSIPMQAEQGRETAGLNVERAVRPVAQGRGNHLLAGSDGARRSGATDQRPRNCGGRLARNAATPSRKSAVSVAATKAARSASNCSASRRDGASSTRRLKRP